MISPFYFCNYDYVRAQNDSTRILFIDVASYRQAGLFSYDSRTILRAQSCVSVLPGGRESSAPRLSRVFHRRKRIQRAIECREWRIERRAIAMACRLARSIAINNESWDCVAMRSRTRKLDCDSRDRREVAVAASRRSNFSRNLSRVPRARATLRRPIAAFARLYLLIRPKRVARVTRVSGVRIERDE